MAASGKRKSFSSENTPTKTSAKNHKLMEEPDSAENIIAAIKLTINERADGLQASINDLKDSVEFIHSEMKELKDKMAETTKRVDKTEEKLPLPSSGEHNTRDKRRWDLRLLGIKEQEGEDVRNKVISICQKTTPGCKGKLPDVIDSMHQLGRVMSTGHPREVIIQFSMRHYRDTVWKAAKQSSFLKENNLRFKEDFSPEDRQRRNLLWPQVKKAREEGKTSFYIGPRAFVVDRGGKRSKLEPAND